MADSSSAQSYCSPSDSINCFPPPPPPPSCICPKLQEKLKEKRLEWEARRQADIKETEVLSKTVEEVTEAYRKKCDELDEDSGKLEMLKAQIKEHEDLEKEIAMLRQAIAQQEKCIEENNRKLAKGQTDNEAILQKIRDAEKNN